MSFIVTLPNGVEYLGASLLLPMYLLLGQHTIVSQFRRRAGIAYPNVYAEKAVAEKSLDAMKFNCAQRAHQNTLENIPFVYVLAIGFGLKYPILAAYTVVAWVIGRIGYTRGYITGIPGKRLGLWYVLSTAATVAQLLGSTYVAASAVYSTLF